MFVVAVTFQIKQERMPEFLLLMMENASQSLENEPDCHVFDVCVDDAGASTVFLYEVYTHRAAFDLHLESSHFKEFDAAVAAMIESKQVQTFVRVNS